MKQNEISPAPGSIKARKRVGRGNGSGHGTYSGRGLKGQKARSGHRMVRGFEGGQLPLILRLPRKRGFTNVFKTEYTLVNLDRLNEFAAGAEVSPEAMLAAGIIKTLKNPVKVLARGEVDRALSVKANKFSAAARTKIEAAGGTVEELEYAAATD